MQSLNQSLTKALEHKNRSQLQSKTDSRLTSIFTNKPFYCEWTNYLKKDYCNEDNARCFNHIIGLPKNKQGLVNPLFDYPQELFNTLQSKKMVYCLKASGLGITDLWYVILHGCV